MIRCMSEHQGSILLAPNHSIRPPHNTVKTDGYGTQKLTYHQLGAHAHRSCWGKQMLLIRHCLGAHQCAPMPWALAILAKHHQTKPQKMPMTANRGAVVTCTDPRCLLTIPGAFVAVELSCSACRPYSAAFSPPEATFVVCTGSPTTSHSPVLHARSPPTLKSLQPRSTA